MLSKNTLLSVRTSPPLPYRISLYIYTQSCQNTLEVYSESTTLQSNLLSVSDVGKRLNAPAAGWWILLTHLRRRPLNYLWDVGSCGGCNGQRMTAWCCGFVSVCRWKVLAIPGNRCHRRRRKMHWISDPRLHRAIESTSCTELCRPFFASGI